MKHLKILKLTKLQMKRKILTLIILLISILGLTNCANDCEQRISTCTERPPTDELCTAAFDRWFYNEGKNKCEQISYSGCSQNGFETQLECEECKCR